MMQRTKLRTFVHGSTEKRGPIRHAIDIIASLLIIDILAVLFYGRYIIYTERVSYIPQAQVGVVLMGDFNKTRTDIGPQTERRLNYTLELYKSGYLDYLLCVGGSRPKDNVLGSEMMRNYLIAQGVDPNRVFNDTDSYDTYTNWQEASKIIQDNGWKTVIVISSPFHIFRARKIFEANPVQNLMVYYISFNYRTIEPRASVMFLWKRIHYEWLALLVQSLPPPIYQKFIRAVRNQ